MRPRHVPVLLSAACADVARRHSSGGDRAPVRTCCVRSAMPPTERIQRAGSRRAHAALRHGLQDLDQRGGGGWVLWVAVGDDIDLTGVVREFCGS